MEQNKRCISTPKTITNDTSIKVIVVKMNMNECSHISFCNGRQ